MNDTNMKISDVRRIAVRLKDEEYITTCFVPRSLIVKDSDTSVNPYKRTNSEEFIVADK